MAERFIESEEFVEELTNDLLDRPDTKYIFFLGAGCSKTSGIPLAGELAEHWANKILTAGGSKKEKLANINGSGYTADKARDHYFEIFELLFPSPVDQQKEIKRLCEESWPGFGYFMLASLMYKYPSCNTVITTNFDDLVADALLFNDGGKTRPLVITHHALSPFIVRSDTPLIVKLHGDAHLAPANRRDNTVELDKCLIDKLKPLLQNTKIVFLGYGGGDKSINHLLMQAGVESIYDVYWVGSQLPQETALTEWWGKLPYRACVQSIPFDSLMLRFKERLDLATPDFEAITRTLKDSYEKTQKIESGGLTQKQRIAQDDSLSSIAAKAKKWMDIQLAADNLEKSNPDQADTIFLLGIKQFPKSHELLANYALFLRKIRRENDRAEEYYKKALNIAPDDADTLSAYANFLGVIRKDFDQAEKYYLKALKADPDGADTLGNYAQLLCQLDRSEKAKELFERALQLPSREDLQVELWFYAFAHHFRETTEAISELKKRITRGARSPGWTFAGDIEQAKKKNHPEISLLEALSSVIANDADPSILDKFPSYVTA